MTPTLGVVSRVTDVLATVRTWEGSPILDAFRSLLRALPGDELRAQLPAALGEALLPLRLAPERALLAIDVAVEFDLYEASEGLARLLRVDPTAEYAARAAVLATHPGASPSLREVVQMAANGLTSENAALNRKFAISANPAVQTGSDADRLAVISVWPGRSAVGYGDPPLIAVAANAGSAGQRLEFALDARMAGARVRRLPSAVVERPPDVWLSGMAAIVTARMTDDDWWSSLPHAFVASSEGNLPPAGRANLLRRINQRLPNDRRLRLDGRRATAGTIDSPFETIDVFLAGAFRTHEMAFLAGMSRASIAKTCRTHPELEPRPYHGINYWPFPTLVGLRAWNYVRRVTRRRLTPALAAEFVRMANQERAVPVAITGNGDVLMELDDGIYADTKGQSTSDVFFVAGDIRQVFSLGGQRTAPDLLTPSHHTVVNPGVHGGSPTVRGTRVTTEALEHLARRAIEDGMTGAAVTKHVRTRFPELSVDQIEDGVQTARELIAVS